MRNAQHEVIIVVVEYNFSAIIHLLLLFVVVLRVPFSSHNNPYLATANSPSSRNAPSIRLLHTSYVANLSVPVLSAPGQFPACQGDVIVLGQVVRRDFNFGRDPVPDHGEDFRHPFGQVGVLR